MRVPALLLIATILPASSACGPTVDLSKGLQVNVISSGWDDAGIVNGNNKLVPSISFTLKNVSDQNLVVLQINGVFRRVTSKQGPAWGTGLANAAGSSGLAPGATTPVLTVKSEAGYTSTDPRPQILNNRQFIDGKVELFGKYGSTKWMLLGEYAITRRLIAP
jgi:hypothetical protein